MTRPLRRLRATTEDLASGDLEARAQADGRGPGEVQGVGVGLQHHGGPATTPGGPPARLRRRSFHQLRTPLTALRLRLEQAAATIAATDPTAAARRLDAATVEIDRLSRLAEGLLALARAEGTAARVEIVDVAAVARGARRQWRPLAEERGVTLARRPASRRGTAWARAPARSSRSSTATSTTPSTWHRPAVDSAGLTVEADRRGRDRSTSSTKAPASPLISAPGPSTASGRARARTGSGLGLAITHQLATASGGTVDLGPAPGGGIDATATFPIAPPKPRGNEGHSPAAS